MDALNRMQVVWPSAGRALELLRGSKYASESNLVSQAPQQSDRYKRPAERPMGDDHSMERSNVSDQRSNHAPPRHNTYRHPAYIDAQQEFPDSFHLRNNRATGSSTNHDPQYFPSHERWPASHNYGGAPPPGPLSTSALHQLYSTELADGQAYPMRYRSPQGLENTNTQSRYPQFWNDLSSTFPQLGAYATTAPLPTEQGPVSEPGPMYISDPYNIYSASLPPYLCFLC